jgi:hypothetical protein
MCRACDLVKGFAISATGELRQISRSENTTVLEEKCLVVGLHADHFLLGMEDSRIRALQTKVKRGKLV